MILSKSKKLSLNEKYLILSIIPMALFSVIYYSRLEVNTIISWGFHFIFYVLLFRLVINNFKVINNNDFLVINIFLVILIFSVLRSVFEISNYWETKYLIENSFCVFFIAIVYALNDLIFFQNFLRFYLKIFFLMFVTFASISYFSDFLATNALFRLVLPLSFIMLFFPSLSSRLKISFIIIVLLTTFLDQGGRSNIIKFMFSAFLIIYYYTSLKVKILKSKRILSIICKIIFASPVILLIFALYFNFNIFQINDYSETTISSKVVTVDGTEERNIGVDTRTFLYDEVLNSAINNNYVLFGRSLGRGNDTETFISDLYGTRDERPANEVGVLNVFTWFGFIGLFTYFCIFYHSSMLALKKSNNMYSKLIGLNVAFQWAYSWAENFQTFDFLSLTIYLSIGFCLSGKLRQMSDSEINVWIEDCTNRIM